MLGNTYPQTKSLVVDNRFVLREPGKNIDKKRTNAEFKNGLRRCESITVAFA